MIIGGSRGLCGKRCCCEKNAGVAVKTVYHWCVFEPNQCTPEPATGTKLAAEITDKKGYGKRWGFSLRQIDNLLRRGMPHLKVGERRVRIIIPEADAWMREQFATRRRGSALKMQTKDKGSHTN